MNIYKVDSNDLMTQKELLINNKNSLAYTIASKKFVALPKKNVEVDYLKLADLGYDMQNLPYFGGTIVVEEGDIDIVYIGDFFKNTFAFDFTNYFVKWLQNKGLNAIKDNNDILIDNYKVYGMSNQGFFFGGQKADFIHIGINTNLENIKEICTKPMIKIPKGLSEYGITTEEVEQVLLDFCNNYNK